MPCIPSYHSMSRSSSSRSNVGMDFLSRFFYLGKLIRCRMVSKLNLFTRGGHWITAIQSPEATTVSFLTCIARIVVVIHIFPARFFLNGAALCFLCHDKPCPYRSNSFDSFRRSEVICAVLDLITRRRLDKIQ